MLRTLSACLAVVLLVFVAAGQTKRRDAASARAETGKIIGVVLDKYEARVTNATVRISSRAFKRELTTDDEGAFEVELPADDYRITVEASGFRKFDIPTRKVRPGVSEAINVHLEVLPPSHLVPAEGRASLTNASPKK